MKYPLFNSNAWIGLQEVPAHVQRHEIKLEIKKRSMANIHRRCCGLCEQCGGALASTCAYFSVDVCVHVKQLA